MPRSRSIKPEFWDDEKLARLSRDIRLLFIGTWKCADDEGVCKGNHSWLKAQIFPYDEIPSATFTDWMCQLEAGGFLVPFEENGESYYLIKNFLKHQKIDHPSKIKNPRPPEGLARDSRETREDVRKTPPQTETETKTETKTETEPATGVAGTVEGPSLEKTSVDPRAIELANQFAVLMKINMPEILARMKNGYLKAWQDSLDKLIRIDKRDPNEIAQLITHCFDKDKSWWASTRNIRSPVKFRDRNREGVFYYDVILEEMKHETHQQNTGRNRNRKGNPAPYGDGEPYPIDYIANIETGELIHIPRPGAKVRTG